MGVFERERQYKDSEVHGEAADFNALLDAGNLKGALEMIKDEAKQATVYDENSLRGVKQKSHVLVRAICSAKQYDLMLELAESMPSPTLRDDLIKNFEDLSHQKFDELEN